MNAERARPLLFWSTWARRVVFAHVAAQVPFLYALWAFGRADDAARTLGADLHELTRERASMIRVMLASAVVLALVALATWTLFFGWLSKAHAIANDLETKESLRTRPLRAVASFFVPIANLFVPYRQTSNLVLALELPESEDGASLAWVGPSFSVGAWWAATLASAALVSMTLNGNGVLMAFGVCVSFAAAALTASLVRGITELVVERARRLDVLREQRPKKKKKKTPEPT